jgi:hypothetical protein
MIYSSYYENEPDCRENTPTIQDKASSAEKADRITTPLRIPL